MNSENLFRMSWSKIVLGLAIFFVVVAIPTFALDIAISPPQDSVTTIKDQSCGQSVQLPFTLINNGGGGDFMLVLHK